MMRPITPLIVVSRETSSVWSDSRLARAAARRVQAVVRRPWGVSFAAERAAERVMRLLVVVVGGEDMVNFV